jgi:hypothetical protein
MATATCAICGATVEVTRLPGNWKIEADYDAMARLCQARKPRRGLQGDSPTGCPHLDDAAMLQMPRRTPPPPF